MTARQHKRQRQRTGYRPTRERRRTPDDGVTANPLLWEGVAPSIREVVLSIPKKKSSSSSVVAFTYHTYDPPVPLQNVMRHQYCERQHK